MDRIDMSLDDIIKGNKKRSKQPTRTSAGSNNNNSNKNNKTTGPIRTRSAGKKLTRQKTNPYPVRIKSKFQLIVSMLKSI